MNQISPDAEDAQAATEPIHVKSEETPKIEVVKKPRSEAQKAALEKARLNATAARAEKAAAKRILKDPEPEPEEEIEYVRKKKPVKRRIVVDLSWKRARTRRKRKSRCGCPRKGNPLLLTLRRRWPTLISMRACIKCSVHCREGIHNIHDDLY